MCIALLINNIGGHIVYRKEVGDMMVIIGAVVVTVIACIVAVKCGIGKDEA